MKKTKSISNFISLFSDISEPFKDGLCYWFAFVLAERFDGEIYYDIIDNHFVTKIDNKFYDVSGEVNGDFVKWSLYKEIDPIHYKRIIKDCVNK